MENKNNLKHDLWQELNTLLIEFQRLDTMPGATSRDYARMSAKIRLLTDQLARFDNAEEIQ